MMRKNLCSVTLYMAPSLALGFPLLGAGPYTVIDPAVLAERIVSNKHAIEEHLDRSKMGQLASDQEAMLSAARIDANNNAMANAAVRANQREADTYNLEVSAQGNPADSCAAFAVSQIMEDLLCQSEAQIVRATALTDQASIGYGIAFEGTLGISGESVPLPPPEFDEEDLGFTAALLGDPVSHDSYTSGQVLSGISMMTPSTSPPVTRRQLGEAESLGLMQQILRGNLPQKSLIGIEGRRAETEGFSEAGALSLFSSMHFSEDRTADLSTGANHNEASLWRERYMSLAFRVWRTVNEYEISLNNEVLVAVQLLELLDSPSN